MTEQQGMEIRVIEEGAITSQVQAAIAERVDVPGGVAPLDGNRKVPDGNSQVYSVAGKRGAVLLDASDVAGAQATSQKGQPGGYGSLDQNGKQPLGEVNASLLGAARRQGTWDASAGTAPASGLANTDADRGKYWEVSVAGTTLLGGKNDWNPGDWIVWEGADWGWVDNTDRVGSVEGRTGAVTLGDLFAAANDARLRTVRDEGVARTNRPVLDFVGNGVSVTDDAAGGRTQVEITGAGVGVATETLSGTVKGNAPAASPADPRVYFRSDPVWETFRDGCKLVWNSAASLTVEAGALWVPGLSKILNVPASITKNNLALAANTWYAVYVFDNAGTPDYELVAYTPAAPNPPVFYKGHAAQKPGDATRRFRGWVRCGATANTMLKFWREGNLVKWREDEATTLRLFSGLANTARQVRDASPLVPPTARMCRTRIQTNGQSGTFWDENDGPVDTENIAAARGGQFDVSLDASQRFGQRNNAAGGATDIGIIGYYEER